MYTLRAAIASMTSLAVRRVQLFALGNEMLVFQAGSGGSHGSDGHGAPATEVFQFGQQVGATDGQSAADARHSVNLGEGAQHDHVAIGFDEIERADAVGKMDVGFVHEHD